MRRITGVLVAVMALAACAGGPGPDPSCTDPAPATSVELADFEFVPKCIGAASGDTIALENTGVAPHTFTVEGTDVDVNVVAASSGTANLVGVGAGAYAVTCTFHAQMIGTIVVS